MFYRSGGTVLGVLAFLILQYCKCLNFPLTNFALNFLFESSSPPLASSSKLQRILIITCKDHLCLLWQTKWLWRSSKIFTCSVSVLTLWKFIRIYWSAPIMIKRIKILPALYVFCLSRTKDFQKISFKLGCNLSMCFF